MFNFLFNLFIMLGVILFIVVIVVLRVVIGGVLNSKGSKMYESLDEAIKGLQAGKMSDSQRKGLGTVYSTFQAIDNDAEMQNMHNIIVRMVEMGIQQNVELSIYQHADQYFADWTAENAQSNADYRKDLFTRLLQAYNAISEGAASFMVKESKLRTENTQMTMELMARISAVFLVEKWYSDINAGRATHYEVEAIIQKELAKGWNF